MNLERELKFSLAAGSAARASRLLPFAAPPRRSELHSIYYDTPDLRLQRAGAALRLRRAGRKWLQTLKLARGPQGALASRAEWEMPAPKGRLDCALFPREALRAASGQEPARLARELRPLFATRFERRAGPLALRQGARAEACIDRGTIEAGRKRAPILELELELTEGGIGPLLEFADGLIGPLGLRIETASKAERGYRLRASAGAPPPQKWSRPRIGPRATASEAFAAVCGAALAQIAANAAGLGDGRDPEYLHQLRVGVRRLRSARHGFRGLLSGSKAQEAERPLKRNMKKLGAARDWDVFCGTLAAARAGSGISARARAKRAAARKVAAELVRSAAFQHAQLSVLRWLHGDPWKSSAAREEPLERFAHRTLARLHARLLEDAQGIDWRNAKRRHRVRIRVKRLRYACDFFSGCFPHQAVLPFISRLASLQDALGELNDLAVARRLAAEIDPEDAEKTLRRWLDRRERELIASLEPAWKAFAGRRAFWQPPRGRRGRR